MVRFGDYELNDSRGWDLEEEEMHVLRACIWMVDNKTTIRETAKNWEYSPTTFWRRIHKECKELSPDLYSRVCHQILINLERRHWI